MAQLSPLEMVPAMVPSTDRLIEPAHRSDSPAHMIRLVAHLARNEIDASHRMTVLGWLWPLMRQIAQLLTLVFIFGSVINLDIPHFPVYVFVGLVSWTWFSTGIGEATTSLLDQRHLVFQPKLPNMAIPMVSVMMPLVDVLLALPVLLVMVAVEHGISWTIVLVIPLLLLQLIIMCGISWIVSAVTVFFRDVPQFVSIGLQVLFYLTPVFYRRKSVPSKYGHLLELNPMTTIVEGYRSIMLGQASPSLLRFAGVTVGALVLFVCGYLVFRRYSLDFVDSL
jgi:lipopolysaccharide transport system permease protein